MMNTTEALFGFLGVTVTQMCGFGLAWVQMKGNHIENTAKLDLLAEKFDDHMTRFHGGDAA
jgi:hypothetical protein